MKSVSRITGIAAVLVGVLTALGCENPIKVDVAVGVTDTYDLNVLVRNVRYNGTPMPGYGVEDWWNGVLLDEDVTDGNGWVRGLRTRKNVNAVDVAVVGPRDGNGNHPFTWYFRGVRLEHSGQNFTAYIDTSDPFRAPQLVRDDGVIYSGNVVTSRRAEQQ